MTRTLFAGGLVFDPASGEVAGADVVVEDGLVVDVGPGLDGDASVDCTGQTLLPGLFDCHVHTTISTIDLLADLATPFSYQFFQAEQNLAATLAAGITTVRDLGGADLGVKQAVDDGLVRGPRMQIAITMLSQTGGHGDRWSVCGGEIPQSFGLVHPGKPASVVDGPDAVRQRVRELIRAGADVIKVATSGGVLSARDDPRHAHFADDELAIIVAEATRANRPVAAHAQAADGIKAALRAGFRSIEHGIYLDDEAIQLLLDRGAWLVPTLLAPVSVLEAAEAGARMPAVYVEKCAMVLEHHRDSITRAVGAGVQVAMGTDSGVGPHGTNLRELALLAECGLSPAAALQTATTSAARLLRVDDELGAIEPGKRADLVVVDGDPFDLKTLPDHIVAVWKDGELAHERRNDQP